MAVSGEVADGPGLYVLGMPRSAPRVPTRSPVIALDNTTRL